MTLSFPPPAPGVGRFTAAVLGFVVFVCVTMIGGAGYLKYQMDRSETVLAAPDNALGSDQDMFDRLRRDWGYGGFLGQAQTYVSSHDASGFAEMKAEIKSADDIVAHLPDKTPAETRHELAAIGAAFDAALQKIDAPAGSAGGDFTSADLAPLYAALPILDARVTSANAETRLAAQSKMQFWGMLLTLLTWCSLIIAAACTAGIYLTLRDKHSAPMRALAQSVQNMARGDMRTAIWGIERQDMIGELARAVDIARYHFSHLPDLSLLSEQGPLRMRFEGGSRSLFEAMMKAISRDSEHIRAQSASLTEITTLQQDAITTLSGKVDSILQSILQRGQTGDQQLRQAISDMAGSAENLKNAHAHAADQLNRIIPHIQERAQGLAEIAQITGKQIGQALQSLSASETGLRTNTHDVKETLAKLSSTADDLGERLFGAINLLQASGKILAETTEDIKGRFGEFSVAGHAPPPALTPLADRLDLITGQLAALQARMDAPLPAAEGPSLAPVTDRLDLITGQVASLQAKMDDHSVPSRAHEAEEKAQSDVLTQALSELNSKITALASTLPAELSRTLQEDVQRLAVQLTPAPVPAPTALEPIMPADLTKQLDYIGHRMVTFEQALDATQSAIAAAREEIQKPAEKAPITPEFQKQLFDQWFQMSAQIEASRASLVEAISDQIDKLENRMSGKAATTLSRTASDYAAQRQIEQQTQILSELVATLGVLDAHMQQIKSEMHATAR